MPLTRRELIGIAPAAALVLARPARADDSQVQEQDPDAQAQNYVADAARVDKKKFPKYKAGQTCASCDLFDGAAGAATGGCSLFLGRDVAAKGWCQAWEGKKA